MTEPSEIENWTVNRPAQSTLIADPDLRPRVNLATFARAVGISRQAASKAAKSGRIRVDADGKVDLHVALRDYVNHTHPASLKTRQLRDAAVAQRTAAEQARYWRDQAEAARQALAELETSERERARAARTAIRYATNDALARAMASLADDLAHLGVALAGRHGAERLRRALDRGALAELVYRRAWRELSPALAAAIAADDAPVTAPAEQDPAADAPLFANLEESS